MYNSVPILSFSRSSSKLKSFKDRHNKDVTSLIVGSLLSNSYLEKKEDNGLIKIRIIFIKYGNNIEYLMWFHSMLAHAKYCNPQKPKLQKLIGKRNTVLYYYKFKSYSFSSFTWLFELFYINDQKILQQNLYKYITPLALATLYLSSIWAEEKAIFIGQDRSDFLPLLVSQVKSLSLFIKNKYKIETKIKYYSGINSCSLYIKNSSVFSRVVMLHILHSQHYLLKKPTLKLTLFGGHRRGLITSPDFFNSRDSKRKLRKQYKLSLEQKEALIGILLGDGHLQRLKSTRNTTLYIEQSYPEKEEYVNFLYKLMEPIVLKSPSIVTRKPDKRSGKVTQSFRFLTMAMPCLNYYHDLFYKDKVKSVPKNLGEILTARGLAFFIMDDGGKSVYNQTILHTRAFNVDDVKYIQLVLLKNFGLISRLEEKKKDQWVIYIPVKQKTRLKDIVGPYMHESMLYKI